MRRSPIALFALSFGLLSGCATSPLAPPPKVDPPRPPSARSSIAALLEKRAELELTDEQVDRLQSLDEELARHTQELTDELIRQRRSAAMGEAAPIEAPAPGQHRAGTQDAQRRQAVEEKLDDADTKAYLEAEQGLTEAQKPKAQQIATAYRAQLYKYRHR